MPRCDVMPSTGYLDVVKNPILSPNAPQMLGGQVLRLELLMENSDIVETLLYTGRFPYRLLRVNIYIAMLLDISIKER